MTAKVIDEKEFKKAINIVFSEDKDVYKYYDYAANATCVSDIVKDVYEKCSTYENAIVFGVYEKNKLIGYFVRGKGMLISFGLNTAYRVRKYKNMFFSLIKKEFKGMFVCFLKSQNVRAIRWLIKMGMKEMEYNETITKLILT